MTLRDIVAASGAAEAQRLTKLYDHAAAHGWQFDWSVADVVVQNNFICPCGTSPCPCPMHITECRCGLFKRKETW